MTDPASRTDVVEDIALLYELALSVGSSLDLNTNCRTFLSLLLARKGLNVAGVWLRGDLETGGAAAVPFDLAFALPASAALPGRLDPDHPLRRRLADRPSFSAGWTDPAYDECLAGTALKGGAFAVFDLPDIGLLLLHAPKKKTPFDRRHRSQLRDVIARFATSLHSALLYRRLQAEMKERRRAEREVTALKNFYEQVLDVMPAQLAVFDTDLRYVHITASAVRDAELRAWMLGKTDAEYARHRGRDPAIGRQRMTMLQRVIDERKPIRFEESFHTADGGEHHFLRIGSPVFDNEGNVSHVLGYGLDITDVKHAEQALRESEERWRALVANHPEPIMISVEGEIVYTNKAGAELFGAAAPGQIVGRSLFEFLAPETHSLFEARKAAVQRGEPTAPLEHRIIRLDGTERFAEAFSVPITYHGRRAAQAVVRDVTERKRAEAALRESEARYKQLVESAGDIIYRTSPNGEFQYVNPVGLRLFELQEEEIVGRHFTEFVDPSDRERVAAFYKQQFDAREPSTYLEFLAVTSTGKPLWIGQSVQLILKGDRITSLQAVARDITERKAVERALRKARQATEHALRAREQFLANMSHEMRTPLNAVIGMTHLLLGSDPEPRHQTYLNGIKYSADNLLALINDILDLAKIESGKIAFEAVPFSPEKTVRRAVQTVALQAEEKGLRLDAHTDPLLPAALVGDPVRLGQILLNLLANAIKFTDAGRVGLSAMVSEQGSKQVCVRFTVTDTGIGIPPDKRAVIFDMFTQARSDTTRRFGGTGLGLAIVKELTERQGGRISVESVEGQGSTFTVELPFRRTDAAELERARVEAETEADIAGARILLVEDNELNQVVAEEMLTGWGAHVTVATNGREAVEHVRAGAFDVVLMDIQMPEVDGYEATHQIRTVLRKSADELPVLALTASALIDHRIRMEAAGMNDVILKPFDPVQLRRRIARYLPADRPTNRQLTSTAIPERPADRERLYDLSLLRETGSNQPAFLLRIIDLFLRQAPDQLAALDRAVADEDWTTVEFTAHKAKSAARTLGITPLADRFRAMERAASLNRDLDHLPTLLAEAHTFAEQALAQLRHERESLAEAAA